MLDELRISGLGVIEDAVLDLGPGLTVVTGETGAGKTMVVTSLALLFGGRADPGLVRPGSTRALVEGRLRIAADGPVAARVAEAGGDLDEIGAGETVELLLARTVTAESRSRAHVGGRAVPVAVLAELADHLIAVHGQSDQQRLLRPAAQRDALDRYAGAPVLGLRAGYATTYERHREVTGLLDELQARARERAQELDRLRFGLAEIEAVGPQPGEDRALAAEIERLAHADALRAAAAGAHDVLAGEPTSGDDLAEVAGLLAAARRALDGVREHDPVLAGLADRVAEAAYQLADVAAELASYASGVEADPARLGAAQDRLATLTGLARKYTDPDATGGAADAALAWSARAAGRLLEIEGDDDRIATLGAEGAELQERLGGLAAELSAARQAAASRFGTAVSAELADLAMPHARVSAVVRPGETFGPTGVDEVELLLEPHPGAPARPLQKGASGGELSRIMLAVEVVFAGADPVPTFVFDEVDAGVGGRAAVEVGRRLARLARTAQVIVVTHLPQVAAFADRHLVVVKTDDGAVTRSGVTVLDDAGRVRELSRMLAGLEESELARSHAQELLAVAAADRAQGEQG